MPFGFQFKVGLTVPTGSSNLADLHLNLKKFAFNCKQICYLDQIYLGLFTKRKIILLKSNGIKNVCSSSFEIERPGPRFNRAF